MIILRKWYGHWLLGTTDTPYSGDKSNPTAEKEDVDYLLRNVNKLLRRKIERADLLGTYAGLRPLLAPAGPGSAKTTSALSRDHAVIEAPEGMVTIVGGKYTTYRIMARDAVDAAARSLGRDIAAHAHGETSRWSERRVGEWSAQPAARVSPPSTACPSRRCGGCCTATATSCPTCWRRSAATPALGHPIDRYRGLPARGVPPRRHPRGRVRPSTTCSPAAPTSPSRIPARAQAPQTRSPAHRPRARVDAARQKEEVADYDAQPRLATAGLTRPNTRRKVGCDAAAR